MICFVVALRQLQKGLSDLSTFQRLLPPLPISGCVHRLGVSIAASVTFSELENVSFPALVDTMFNGKQVRNPGVGIVLCGVLLTAS